MSLQFRISLLTAALMVTALLAPFPTDACGYHYPYSLLDGDGRNVLWAPVTSKVQRFDEVISSLGFESPYTYVEPPSEEWIGRLSWTQTNNTDMEDVGFEIRNLGLPEREQEEILTQYNEVRTGLSQYSKAMSCLGIFNNLTENPEIAWKEWFNSSREIQSWWYRSQEQEEWMPLDDIELSEWIPDEYRLYTEGAVLFYQGNWEDARETWKQIFALPYYKRQHRSTWAAFMIAKTLLYENPDGALYWFEKVRFMVDMDYRDRLGLAANTYLWEARLERSQGNYTRALESYLEFYQTGDREALVAFNEILYQAFEEGQETIQQLAMSPVLREVIGVWLNSSEIEHWLLALETVGVTDIQYADHLAWKAYNAGEFDSAELWLERCPETPISTWLDAKLLMRAGEFEHAAELLKQAIQMSSSAEQWDRTEVHYWNGFRVWNSPTLPPERILGELGVLQLSMGQFEDALDSLLRSNFWTDAAYIAESALTAEELKLYVDENWPDPASCAVPDPASYYRAHGNLDEDDAHKAYRIRYLLGRRLIRLGRFIDARAYLPLELRYVLDRYVLSLNTAEDETSPDSVRADAFWDAALIARHQGMNLLATELEPDFHLNGGNFCWARISYRRFHSSLPFLFPITDAESERVERTIAEEQPEKKWHYRYVALELAWACTELMTDNDEQLASRLCIAGSWVKSLNPEIADPFYKAIVLRCPDTWLGREADRIHWFPDCDGE